MKVHAAGWLVVLWLVATGCAPSGPIQVSLHPLGLEDEPLNEAHTLPVEFGLQGGFHVYLRLTLDNVKPGASDRLEGLRQGNLPAVLMTVEGPDGLLNRPSEQLVVLERAEGQWLSEPLLVVLQYYEAPPTGGFDAELRQAELEDFLLTFSAEVRDSRGGEGRGEGQSYIEFP